MTELSKAKLTADDRRRDNIGRLYIYPVISRRAGGLSIGINLNPNQACNWRCIYCQVPNLTRGGAPEINLTQLENELKSILQDILHGDFYARYSFPSELRYISDLAIAGDGEPTTCRVFTAVIEIIRRVGEQFNLIGQLPLTLITNGSLIMRPEIQRGISQWAQLGGRVWFKIDRATTAGIFQINQIKLSPQKVIRNLAISANLCPTWIQTCLFAFDGNPPEESEQQAYLALLSEIRRQGISIAGILLYGLARKTHQPEAARLSKLPRAWIEQFAQRIQEIGYNVAINE